MKQPSGGARAWWVAADPAMRVAVLPFVVSRGIVVLSAALARYLVTDLHPRSLAAAHAANAGLLGWDATWYRRITEHGYATLGHQALRFFPLLPVVSRALGAVPGVQAGTALLVVSNVAAFAAFALLYRLVLFEVGDEPTARRSVWLLALAPSAFVLVMGYAESLLLVTTLVAFLGIRERRYGLAICAGFAAGLCRPVGVLLVVPALIEAVRNWPAAPRAERALALGAVAAAPLGTAAYLAWVQATVGGAGAFLLPLREQLSRSHRGIVADPLTTLARDAHDFVRGAHLGTAQHAPWAVVMVVLAVYLFLKLPVSYGGYAAATLVVALSAPNLDSLERYGMACFPFAIAVAMLTGRRSVRWAVLALAGSLLTVYGLLAFLGLYVP